MRKRAAVVLAVLIGLLAPAVPASAAAPLTVSGRVLDETGRPVAGATVRTWFRLHLEVEEPELGIVESIFWAFGCVISLGFLCDRDEDRTENVAAVARTDRNGRYVLRLDGYDTAWEIVGGVAHDVDVTAPVLVRGTAPATMTTGAAHLTRASTPTLPTFRLWLRGASINAVSPTRRRLRAGVPSVLGRPVRPAKVYLVQGWAPVWSYGEVPRDVDVDSRVVEDGTTGTQSFVTTTAGSMRIEYRSGVRPVTKAAMPLSRGRRCYDGSALLGRQIRGCPLTDGDLAEPVYPASSRVVVDLEDLSVPEAYVVHGCDVLGVETSIDGEVFLGVETEQRERRVRTGRPDLPARYVRLRLDGCAAAEVSIYGRPYALPLPKAPNPTAPVAGAPTVPATPPVTVAPPLTVDVPAAPLGILRLAG
ncbi:MAG TPA: hypothetical protein VF519_07030 [Mycobacteriales bacterium]|jgi:hypothetical protein